MTNEFRLLDSHLNNLEQLAELQKIDIKKSKTARQTIAKLESHKTTIERLIPSLMSKLQALKRYPVSQGYLGADPQIKRYLKDAKQEAKELRSMIKDGRKWLKSKQYYKIKENLETYANSRFTLIPLMKTYIANCQKIIQKNKNYSRNPQFLSKKRTLYQKKKQQPTKPPIASWKKSPASWYDQINTTLQSYWQKSKKISNSMKDKSATIVHFRLELEIKKVQEIPQSMAELQRLIASIQKQGKKFPQKQAYTQQEKAFQKYLKSKRIEIVADEEIASIQKVMQDIDEELHIGGWVEEATLRLMLRNLQSISRKFEEAYVPVNSMLLNLEYQ